MRILDIGVATGYALLCLTLVSTMNPYLAATQAVRTNSEARASEAVVAYVGSVGLVYLATASPADVCASLAEHSNSTLAFGGMVDGHACSEPPAGAKGSYSLALSLAGRQLVIEGWIEGQ